MFQVEQSMATALEHSEFVVQSFDKAATVPVDKVVDDFLPPAPRVLRKRSKQRNSLSATRLIHGSVL
jgi:hypothetical protein